MTTPEQPDSPAQPYSERLSTEEQRSLREHIERWGIAPAAGACGVSVPTLARAAAGLRIRRGSIELVRRMLGP
jgi:hypothetical protein